MSYTAAFGPELDALGIWWPRGDGSALRSAATGWGQMADYLDDLTAALDGAARRALDEYTGQAAAAFENHWATWSTDPGHLPQVAADCRRLMAALNDFSYDIDAADRTIAQLIELALTAVVTNPIRPGWTGLLDLGPEWHRWLHEQTTSICSALERRAERCGHALHGTGLAHLHQPDHVGLDDLPPPNAEDVVWTWGPWPLRPPIDLGLIDPEAIEWVDPGTPVDRRHLGTAPVDFGAGQAPPLPTDPPPPPGPPLAGPPPCPPAQREGVEPVPQEPEPEPVPPVEPLPPPTVEGGEGAAEVGPAPSAPAVVVPPPVDLPAFDPPPLTTPGTQDLAAVGWSTEAALPLTPLGPPADAAAAAASGGSGRSGRMPLPMMPMMGMAGGANDDGQEPRRRRVRY